MGFNSAFKGLIDFSWCRLWSSGKHFWE